MTLFQKEQIKTLRGQSLSYTKISTCLGISKNTVKSYCKRNNLGGKANISTFEMNDYMADDSAYCKQCGKIIEQRSGVKPRKFCSDLCRVAWWNSHPDKVSKKAIYQLECACCKKPFESYGNKDRKYCSHICYVNCRFNQEIKKNGDNYDAGTI